MLNFLASRLSSPRPLRSNACFGFDKTTGWTFFDLTSLHDNLENNEGTVLEADFYHADQLLPRSDEDLVAKASKGRAILECLIYRLLSSGGFFSRMLRNGVKETMRSVGKTSHNRES